MRGQFKGKKLINLDILEEVGATLPPQVNTCSLQKVRNLKKMMISTNGNSGEINYPILIIDLSIIVALQKLYPVLRSILAKHP